MRRVKLIVVFLLISCVTNASAFTHHCRNALYHALYLNFQQAKTELILEKDIHPSNIYIPYIENYIDFLQIVLNETPEIIDSYNKNFQTRYTTIEKLGKNTTLKGLLLAEMNLQSSVIYAKLNEHIKGFRYLYNAEKLIARHPEFNSQTSAINKLKPVAIMVNTYLPPVLKNMVSLHDKNNESFRIMNAYRKSIAKDSLLSLEYDILQSFLYLQFSNKTLEVLENMHHQIISSNYNPLLCWAYALIAMRNGKLAEAITVLNEALKRTDGTKFPFLYFLKGEIKTYSQFNGIEEFEMFLKYYKGKNHVKTALQKLSWNYFINGDTVAYHACKSKVLIAGVSWNDSDAEALREASETLNPNIYLLKSRLLFDGGMYNKARAELAKKQALHSLLTERDRLEFIYRFARINHATGDISSAKRFYSQIISLGGNKPYYFAANSSLQLGLIAENEKTYADAEKYFKLCLELNKYGYTSGIHAKAKAGLKRVKGN